MTVPQRFSHSRLSTLDDCPRRYEYQYVKGLRAAFQTVEAFRGNVAHDALGWLYTEREERREPGPDELVERYRHAWRSRHSGDVKIVQEGMDLDGYRREGEEWLRRHHATTFATDRRETLAVERKVETTMGGQPFVGYVDRLARDRADGTLHVVDYKTGKRMPATAAEAGLQLRAYAVAVLETHGGAEVRLEYDYLQHGKTLAESMPREEVPAVAAAVGAKVEEALRAEARGEFPPRPGRLCAWCGFRAACDVSGFAERPAQGAGAAEQAERDRTCPRCGARLRVRNGSRGLFVGCTGYPSCRYTRDARPGEAP